MRLRRIIVDTSTVAHWIKHGTACKLEPVDDVPDDLEVHDVFKSFEHDACIEVLVRSDEFDYVPDGTAAPLWPLEFRKVADCPHT